MTDPGTLDATALTRRLHDLVGDERRVQVDFLLHLDEFDRRQAFLPAGFGSLWDYCLRALYLREGAAGRRIGAMRVLRRFPALEAPLRDGRLCLSTASLLGQVLTEENLPELVERAAFRTKAEVEELVVTLRARAAPRDGIRRLSAADGTVSDPSPPRPEVQVATPANPHPHAAGGQIATATDGAPPSRGVAGPEALAGAVAPIARNMCLDAPAAEPGNERPPAPRRASLDPVARDRWSLRVTLDGALKDELETLKMLLSHKVPDGDLTEVLREAVRCAVEKHGRRRGAAAPARVRQANSGREVNGGGSMYGERDAAAPPAETTPAAHEDGPGGQRHPAACGAADESRGADRSEGPFQAPAPDPRAVPAAVRREVWARDSGRCTYVSADGRRCGSRWQLELDHVQAAALDGPPTAANLRLRCRGHNLLHAVEVFGREHMERFRARERGAALAHPRSGEATIAGDSWLARSD